MNIKKLIFGLALLVLSFLPASADTSRSPYYDRVAFNSTTTGTGTLTVGSAVSGFRTPAAAGVTDGSTVRYVIMDGSAWEVGHGVYTASGTTLTRVVDSSTNSNTAISLSGTEQLILTPTSADFNATAFLDVAQNFSKSQGVAVSALTSGVTITPDFAASNNFSLTLATNATLANATNVVAGKTYHVIVTQDGTGSRTLAYGANYKWSGGTAPTLSLAPNAIDMVNCYVADTTHFLCGTVLNFQ